MVGVLPNRKSLDFDYFEIEANAVKDTYATEISLLRNLLASQQQGRDELGQLPEVNFLNRACARELSNQLFAARLAVVPKT